VHISVTDAKGQLTDLVRRAEAGDEIILPRSRPTRHARAVRSPPDFKHRKKLLEAIWTSGTARARRGLVAARAQGFLFGEDARVIDAT
jgi:antitoxin (DNA-binding transcriptional repressor) of toxin-antitoxin stability system